MNYSPSVLARCDKLDHLEMKLLAVVLQAAFLQLDRLAEWPNDGPFKPKRHPARPEEFHKPLRREDIKGMLYTLEGYATAAYGSLVNTGETEERTASLLQELRRPAKSTDG